MKALRVSLVMAASLAVASGTTLADAQAPAADAVFAVLSPIASPACITAGLSTVLVPTVGESLGEALGGQIDVEALLVQASGPVLLLCASFPPTAGTRCEITDGPIAVLWPPDLGNVGVPAPAPIGGLVESLEVLLSQLGVESSALGTALSCTVPTPPNAGLSPVPPLVPAPIQPPPGDDAPALSTTSGTRAASPASAGTGVVVRTPAPAAAAPVGSTQALTPVSAVDPSTGRGPLIAIFVLALISALWRGARDHPPSRRRRRLASA